ncbi:MAG TPA: aspartate kinase [Verrucomicrobiales bacterium]|nr:aspartate kinase [Verrucomicrobiales bacterium]
MRLVVQKYGGTSVGRPERIRQVARRILDAEQAGSRVVAVVSAMAGVTDNLLRLAREVAERPTEEELDVLLATGEQTTIALVAMAVHALGGRAVCFTGAQAGIETDAAHTRARIRAVTPEEIKRRLEDGRIVIVAGFQGRTASGRITTLGRGGSDLTAIALAAALSADACQIFTDVDGVYTCDPRIVPQAVRIPELSYDEMLEMASSGSKVMQSRSVEFAKRFGVAFEVRNSLNDNPGTLVTEENRYMEAVVVRGVSVEQHQAKVTVRNVPDRPGYAAQIFVALAEAGVVIDMIVQNVSEQGATDLSFTLAKADLARAEAALREFVESAGPPVTLRSEDGIAKISAVGIGMRSHSGVAARMFSALAEAGINIRMIATSEIKVSVIVDEPHLCEAASAVHDAFGLGGA